MNKKASILALASAAALAGCGGGSDDNTPPATSAVPDSASASISGFISYLQVLVTAKSDTLSPVDVSNVKPPTDETSSPTSVD